MSLKNKTKAELIDIIENPEPPIDVNYALMRLGENWLAISDAAQKKVLHNIEQGYSMADIKALARLQEAALWHATGENDSLSLRDV